MPIPREPPVTRTDRPSAVHQPARGRGRVHRGRRRDLVPADSRARLLGLVVLGLRGGVAEVVEQADLLLAEAPDRVVRRQVVDQLPHACPDLVREVWGGGADEGLDVVEGRLCHRGASLTTSFAEMRRPTSVEVMLLSAIGLWALNLTVSRYILTHGFQPLAYSTVRYGLAAAIFIGIALVAERTLRIARRDLADGRRRGGRPLDQPDRVRLRAEDDVGLGDRADPRPRPRSSPP